MKRWQLETGMIGIASRITKASEKVPKNKNAQNDPTYERTCSFPRQNLPLLILVCDSLPTLDNEPE